MQKHEKIIDSIASGRIELLFSMAKARTLQGGKSAALGRRYIKIARGISNHYKLKLPKRIKNSICKKCNNVLIPGLNCSVRTSAASRAVIYKCECGSVNRILLLKKKNPT
ncbi:MAG: hypothetical protein KGH72_02710 [Candidatus Micrarchaeota archaeon]|nr:hypothetical protein [Candidatus Micrarchaeota archaeon]